MYSFFSLFGRLRWVNIAWKREWIVAIGKCQHILSKHSVHQLNSLWCQTKSNRQLTTYYDMRLLALQSTHPNRHSANNNNIILYYHMQTNQGRLPKWFLKKLSVKLISHLNFWLKFKSSRLVIQICVNAIVNYILSHYSLKYQWLVKFDQVIVWKIYHFMHGVIHYEIF